MWTILVLLLAPTESAVQISSIETQAGYAVLQGEPVDLIGGYSELIHVIDMKDIGDTIRKLKASISHSFKVNDGWLIVSLNKKLNELEHSLHTLKSHTRTRSRRALVNVGGRAINWLFGNMDDEDRLRIESHLENIDFNQKNIVDNLNKQVRVNNEMQGYLQNVRLIVEQNRDWFNGSYKGVVDESLKITRYNNFVLLINEVKDKIDQVQENVVMSRYGIASRFFLTSDEIDHFNIDGLKLRYMKSSMGSMDNGFMVFVLSVPNFVDEEYRAEIVVPVPNRDSMQLNIEITKTVTIKNVTYFVDRENVLYKMKIVNSCLNSILRNSYDDCHKIEMKERSIVEIEFGNLLLINLKSILYDSCTNFSYPLNGNYIVNFENCEIKIDEFKVKRFESHLNVLVPSFNVLPDNITELLPEFNFTKMGEIKEKLGNQQNNHNFYILYILFFIFISYYILIKIKNCIRIRRDSNLNGGGVICETHMAAPIDLPMSINT